MLRPAETWYHGGVPGLQPGDLILPPCKTGALTFGEVMRQYDPAHWLASGFGEDHPALVHVISEIANAMQYAALWTICPWREGDGHVYLVAPDGLRPLHGSRFEATCWQAKVIQVITPGGVTR